MPAISLLRHGRPSYELSGRFSASELSTVAKKYDQSGIADKPPEAAKQMAGQHAYVISSDLPRSIESALQLGFTEIHHSSPLFREVAIPHFDRGSISMHIDTWVIVLRILSLFGYSRNGESIKIARQRARQATLELIQLAHTHTSILLVGHGFMNYFIAKELLSQNWQGPNKVGKDYWAYSTYIN